MLQAILGGLKNMYMNPMKEKLGMGEEGPGPEQGPASPYQEYLRQKAMRDKQLSSSSPYMEQMSRPRGM